MINRIIRYFLNNRLVTFLLLIVLILGGIATAPFNWHTGFIPRNPVPVDAIPDIGENQQIIATEWMGRSPQDIQDQITYPLTTVLTGIPGVKSVRSTSMFGMSFIYLIFKDNVDFYWSRSRILEKLNSLPSGTLPQGVQPALGPDGTAIGQIYWYTLEGRDPKTGKPTGGWDPQELKSIQDYYVRYALTSASGVSEVASVGGYMKEYQVDIDPEAMKSYGVSVMDIMAAVQKANLDAGAQTIELNKVEYMIRGIGYLKNIQDLEESVVTAREGVPVYLKDVAHINFGPANRRGGLDKDGEEAVGGVVVARYGSNPMEVIQNLKDRIKAISPNLPTKILPDGTKSQITIIPFYDRSGLIKETIGTLESALNHEILISIIVIIVLLFNLKASLLVSGILPLGVLMTFISMRQFKVDANIVALSGIAIAIGVMVDVGIVLVENITRHLKLPGNNGIKGAKLREVIYNSTTEVSGAITTALATTVVSFLPVFAMQASEGKLFRPLAFTKTFALVSSIILGLVVIPTLAHLIFSIRFDQGKVKRIWNTLLIGLGILTGIYHEPVLAIFLILTGINNLLSSQWGKKQGYILRNINIVLSLGIALYYLTTEWLPLGAKNSLIVNFIFVILTIGIILAVLIAAVHYYEPILRWCLKHKKKFLLIPALTLFFGLLIWLGFGRIFGFLGNGMGKLKIPIENNMIWKSTNLAFPGMGKEFMPSLNEGSFLLMPTTMPHSGVEENLNIIRSIDRRVSSIPEVNMVVGKWGRANSALDPAPISMFENTINYKPEYILDEDGHRMRFKTDRNDNFLLKNGGRYNPDADGYQNIPIDLLIQDDHGKYLRQWRPQIHKPDDIWNEIIRASNYPGITSSPKLQPIQTRQIMLSTGMRAPMGIKVYGPDAETIEKASIQIEEALKQVSLIEPSSVFAERNIGSPYIEIHINRDQIARYGMTVTDLQNIIQTAIGGMPLTTTVEGRERYSVRIRYARNLRSTPEEISQILIPTMDGTQIPLSEVASIEFKEGPQMIRSEDTFLTNYIVFDKKQEAAEVNVVEQAQNSLRHKIASGELKLPYGVTYEFAGNYQQQIRASQRLAIVIPFSLLLILLILYFQFKTLTASLIHFSGVFVAFAGGFIFLWLYGQDWFMNFNFAGINMRDLFQMHPINLSVAVWVGFIALFGIATDDGVIMGSYIHQVFEKEKPDTVYSVQEAVIKAGRKRVRPAMMTAAVAIIALLPVLTSTGKGADIMVPMAIPTFGGMIIQVMTMFVVPVLQCLWRESLIKKHIRQNLLNQQTDEI